MDMTQRQFGHNPTPAAPGAPEPDGDTLSTALRHATREAHRRAETSGIIRRMLKRRIDRADYVRYLRNLHPVYHALETRLSAMPADAGFGQVANPALYRQGAIEGDLDALAGPGWRQEMAPLPGALAYARRIDGADPARLAAHAYVRYLGDLNGGFVIRRLLRESLGLGAAELSFYEFDGIGDPAAFRDDFRGWLDRLIPRLCARAVVDEAQVAFRLATELSIEIERCPA